MKHNQPDASAVLSFQTLRFDLIAGLTAAAVVLPKAMAYATVAGLPVAVGLYTAFVPMVIYALLGTSRVLNVSSTASRIPDIEYSALQMHIEGETRFAKRGITLWLAGLNPGVLEVVRKAGLAERLGGERMLFNARAAIERFQTLQTEIGNATEGASA